ncbi:MAG: serine/threonine protein phosphatase PrpC, partial [bacterium]
MKEFSPKSFQTNSFFTQGHSHLVCEDYAIHGDNFFIVADGCSSAKNSDVSARLLTWSAIKNLDKLIDSFGSDNDQEFVTAVSQDIRKSAEAIHFQERLLATLLVGVVTHDQVLISVYGDGNVVTRNKNGIWEVFHIEYQSNAPYYLYYRGDAK